MKNNIIVSDPEILNGRPVFTGTRVPVEALFDYLQFSTIDEFLMGYPHISRAMVNQVLKNISQKMTIHKELYEIAS